MTTMLVELTVELVVDYLALTKEINKMNIPAHLFRSWMTPQIVMYYIFASMSQLFATLIFFVTPASIFFCSSVNPCSCTGGPYVRFKCRAKQGASTDHEQTHASPPRRYMRLNSGHTYRCAHSSPAT